MSFASEMVTILEDALKNHSGLTEIRAPNGASMKYETREQIMTALATYRREASRDTAGASQWGFQKVNFGNTREKDA